MVTTLATTDALATLLIEKGVITDAEFKQKLLEERAVYQRIESDNAVNSESAYRYVTPSKAHPVRASIQHYRLC